VPLTNATASTLYKVSQQSMPAIPLLAAFVSSQQTAVSQLANAYCKQMVTTPSYLDRFFGNGSPTALDTQLGSNVSWFGASGSANRNLVIDALVNNAVGNAMPAAAAAVRSEVDALLTRIQAPPLNSATVSQATVAACTAVLGSAVVTLQ
jgi:hypothetical protein